MMVTMFTEARSGDIEVRHHAVAVPARHPGDAVLPGTEPHPHAGKERGGGRLDATALTVIGLYSQVVGHVQDNCPDLLAVCKLNPNQTLVCSSRYCRPNSCK